MKPLRWMGLVSLSLCCCLASLQACSDDAASDDDADDDASTSSSSSSSGRTLSSSSSGRSGSSSSSSGGSSSSGSSSSSSGDAGEEADASCTEGGESTLDAGSYCGAYEFRKPAVENTPVEADAGDAWIGGPLSAGTYDAVKVEYNGSVPLSIRETLVLDGAGRYTRVRQIITNGNPGPVTQRAGEYTTAGTTLDFTDDCQFSGGDAGSLETPSVQYDSLQNECPPAIRYGGSGIRVTLKQH